MRRVTENLTIAERKRRALSYMRLRPASLYRPSEVAMRGIWPEAKGLGAAAAGRLGADVLEALILEGRVKWETDPDTHESAYKLTMYGRDEEQWNNCLAVAQRVLGSVVE